MVARRRRRRRGLRSIWPHSSFFALFFSLAVAVVVVVQRCCDVRVRRRSRRIPSRSPLLFDTNEIRWSFVIYIQILFILVFTLSYYIGERERSTQTTGKAPNVLMPLLRVGADDDVDRVVSGAEEGTFKGGKDDFISVSRENEEEVKHVGLTD